MNRFLYLRNTSRYFVIELLLVANLHRLRNFEFSQWGIMFLTTELTDFKTVQKAQLK